MSLSFRFVSFPCVLFRFVSFRSISFRFMFRFVWLQGPSRSGFLRLARSAQNRWRTNRKKHSKSPDGQISKKIEKFRKSGRRGQASCGNRPKPVFWSLGGPCDQNEAYTSLVRPFFDQVRGPWSWAIFGRISQKSNFGNIQNNILVNEFLNAQFSNLNFFILIFLF